MARRNLKDFPCFCGTERCQFKGISMAASKISLARVFALLILVAGFQSVWADVWKGNIEAPGKQTIGGKEYYGALTLESWFGTFYHIANPNPGDRSLEPCEEGIDWKHKVSN